MKYTNCLIAILTFVVMLTSYNAYRPLLASDEDDTVIKKCGYGERKKYRSYLIDVNLYTGGGNLLHEKYSDELLCLAYAMSENQDITLVKQSVGFYHDRLSSGDTFYYIGFDVSAEYDEKLDYGRFCTRLIRENVSGIAEEAVRLERVFREKNVAGMVITFRWDRSGEESSFTIWLKREDLSLFNNGKITASELYQRSTITGSSGRVILLPI